MASSFSRVGSATVQLLAPQCTRLPDLTARVKLASTIGLVLSVVTLVISIMTWYLVRPAKASSSASGGGTAATTDGTSGDGTKTDEETHKKVRTYALLGIIAGAVQLVISGWSVLLGGRISSCMTTGTSN